MNSEITTPPAEEVVIDASIILCNWRYATFSKVSPQGKNSMDRIKNANMKLLVSCDKNGDEYYNYCDDFGIDTKCMPIRISSEDEINMICTDWCVHGSPLKEINNDSIPRWWPIRWIFGSDEPGELPEYVYIDLGNLSDKQYIILRCKVVKKPKADVMNVLFSDIWISGIDSIEQDSDRQLNADKDKNDEISNYGTIKKEDEMFGKRKSTKEVVEEEVTTNNIDIQEDKTMSEATETTTPVAAEATAATPAPAKKQRKPIPGWAKFTGGILIGSALTFAGIEIYKKFKK